MNSQYDVQQQYGQHAPNQSSGTWKIILGVVGGVIVLFCLVSSVLVFALIKSDQNDKAKSERISRKYNQERQASEAADKEAAKGILYFREEDKKRIHDAITNSDSLLGLELDVRDAFHEQLSEHHEGKLGFTDINFVLLKSSFDESLDNIDFTEAEESDLETTKQALHVFTDEITRYPLSFFDVVATDFIFAKEVFTHNEGEYESIEGASGSYVAYSIEALSKNSTPEESLFARRLIHHELWHEIETGQVAGMAISRNGFKMSQDEYDEAIAEATDSLFGGWVQLNPAQRQSYLHDKTREYVGTYSDIHPQTGFITLYSMTSEQEDRAEFYSFLMVRDERTELENLMVSDAVLRSKFDEMKGYLSDLGLDVDTDFVYD